MYALRYGSRVSGWWIDGCYTYFGYTDDLLKPYYDAARGGNAQALLALNHGVMHPISRYSEWEDYTCGESNEFKEVPAQRFVNGSELPLSCMHALLFSDVQWQASGTLCRSWAAPGPRLDCGAPPPFHSRRMLHTRTHCSRCSHPRAAFVLPPPSPTRCAGTTVASFTSARPCTRHQCRFDACLTLLLQVCRCGERSAGRCERGRAGDAGSCNVSRKFRV